MKCRKKRLEILEKYCANLILVMDIPHLQVCYFKVFYCHAAEAVFLWRRRRKSGNSQKVGDVCRG